MDLSTTPCSRKNAEFQRLDVQCLSMSIDSVFVHKMWDENDGYGMEVRDGTSGDSRTGGAAGEGDVFVGLREQVRRQPGRLGMLYPWRLRVYPF